MTYQQYPLLPIPSLILPHLSSSMRATRCSRHRMADTMCIRVLVWRTTPVRYPTRRTFEASPDATPLRIAPESTGRSGWLGDSSHVRRDSFVFEGKLTDCHLMS
ncbi:hypothetical protein ABKN59_011903 [Abortiporus biennis]